MKCKLLVERELHVDSNTPKALLDVATPRKKGRNISFWLPVGTLIDDPNCHFIVKMGQAEPADEECALECACTKEELAARLLAAEMLNVGIMPDDRPLYIAGYIRGYNGDGSYKPGPKWAEYQKLQAAADEDDEDELDK